MLAVKWQKIMVLLLIAGLLLVACGGSAEPQAEPAAGESAQEEAVVSEEEATEEVVAVEEEAAVEEEVAAEEAAEDEEAAAAEGEEAAAEEEEVVPLASEEGTLTIWVDGGRVEIMQSLGEQFEAEYGVGVAVQELGFGDVRDQLKIAGPAGEGPDIIIGAHDWLGELVSNGLLTPLDLGDKAENFDPVALQAFTYEGELYGLPYNTEAVALYYNRDLVPEPPQTWEELKEIARALQEEEGLEQGYVLQQGDPYHTYPIFTGFGGYVFGRDDEGNHDPTDLGLDSPGGIAAAEEIDSMVKEGLLRQDVDYGVMMNLFSSGESAMFITGPWALGDVRASGVNYAIAKIPMMEETPRPFVGVQGFMVSNFGKNKLLAQTFLTEYVATDETMQALYEAVPNAPAWLPLREQIDDPDIAMFAESAADGEPMPAIPQMSAVWEAWTDAIVLIFQQQQPAAEAIQDAAATIRETLAEGS
ncbi:MAG: maltose/maltodextrin ABC transporter substrate-binding protein MalE [Anaerolineae bacterium]|nr:maltose/maltodextrin ABC transporter substrate-binding protein MalE [Anaerolineae bacterium]